MSEAWPISLLIVQRPSSSSPVPRSRHSETGSGKWGTGQSQGGAAQEATFYEQDRDPERKRCPRMSHHVYVFRKPVGKFIGQKVSKGVLFPFFSPLLSHFVSP